MMLFVFLGSLTLTLLCWWCMLNAYHERKYLRATLLLVACGMWFYSFLSAGARA